MKIISLRNGNFIKFTGTSSCPVKRPNHVVHTVTGRLCLKSHERCFDSVGEMISWWQPRLNVDNYDEVEEYTRYCLWHYDEIKILDGE